MDSASSRAGGALGELLGRAVGQSDVMTPAIGIAFSSGRDPFDRAAGVRPADRTTAGRQDYRVMPSEGGPPATGRPAAASSSRAARRRGASRSSSRRRRTSDSPSVLSVARRRRRRHGPPGSEPAAAASSVARRSNPSRCGSGGRAAPGGRPPVPTPSTDRPRRPGCRGTSTSSCRPGPTRPTCSQWRTKRFARHRLGLRRLALVVGEDQVASAAVEVDRLAQLAQGQGRALDVPARPARPPPRLPGRLVGQRRAATARSRAGRACWGRRGCRPARPPGPASSARSRWLSWPKPRERGHVEVDGPAGLVGVAGVEHRADQATGSRRSPRWPGAREHAGSRPSAAMSASKRAISSAARSR